MAANSDDPHFSVGYADALAERDRYVFQDDLYQARYDRGYVTGERERFKCAYHRPVGTCGCPSCMRGLTRSR
jgi:hypothetical protein